MLNRIIVINISDIEIRDLKIVFNIEKNLVGYPNKANIKIHNLNENSRNRIKEEGINLELYAGYEDTNVSLIFSGDIINVVHQKIGTEWITEIFAGDGTRVLNTATINKTFAAGVDTEQIYNDLTKQLDGVTKGITQGLKNCLTGKRSLLRALQLSGNVKDWLDKISIDCGFEYSLNDGVIETTQKGAPLSDVPPIVINQSSGMIGSPERTEVGINVKNLLLPELKLARTIRVESISQRLNIGNLFFREIEPIRNQGVYRIDKIIHLGDNRGNQWESNIFAREF